MAKSIIRVTKIIIKTLKQIGSDFNSAKFGPYHRNLNYPSVYCIGSEHKFSSCGFPIPSLKFDQCFII